mmetsp:Transcript_36207/g.84912  ORF Transcript_36207/g.84912 Transcript_36207/m.84912 type:complete len:1060 (-) Transcript_36207:106-3285(-)
MSTQTVAREAFDAFFSADHEKCGQLLEQISSVKGTYDVKVAHNSLINDYYKSGCEDPQLLLSQLTQVYDKARDRDKKEKKVRKRDENEEEPYREDEDLSVLRYNQALLCVQLRQHAQATALLEDLYDSIEPIDDFVAIRICFLLLELRLLQREPEQATNILNYLTKSNAFHNVMRSERKTAEAASLEEVDREAADEAKNEGEGEAEKGEGDGELTETEMSAVGQTLKTVDAADGDKEDGVSGPLPSLIMGSYLPRHGRAPGQISKAEYKFYTSMYRARIAVGLRSTKSAKRDIKPLTEVLGELNKDHLLGPHAYTTGPHGATNDDGKLLEDVLKDNLAIHRDAMLKMLKAQLEYSKQNVRKAMRLISTCQFHFAQSSGEGGDEVNHLHPKGSDHEEETDALSTNFHPAQDPACASVFFNNMGCLHFLMRKPNLATLYFRKAMENCANPPARADKGAGGAYILGGKLGLTNPGIVASKHWLDKRVEIVYNTGLQLLMSQHPLDAFKCFQQCIPAFRTWPRLWLRLAECCIDLHWQSLSATSSSASAASAAAAGPQDASGQRDPSGWPREASHQSWSAPRGKPDGSGYGQLLVWDVHGSGPNCRWLLSTSRDPPLGRRGPPGGDDEDADRSIGSDNAASVASCFWDEAKLAAGGDGALSCAAMCLRNVLTQTQKELQESAALSAGSADGAGADMGTSKPTTPAAEKGASAVASGADKAASSSSARAGKTPTNSGPDNNNNKGSGASSGSRYAVKELQAGLVEDAALIKLAYVSLCLHDYSTAIKSCRRLLEKSHLLSSTGDHHRESRSNSTDEVDDVRKQYTFQDSNLTVASNSASAGKMQSSIGSVSLAVLYLTEGLLALGKVAEAKTLMGSFVGCSAVPKVADAQKGIFQELERGAGAGASLASHASAGPCDQEAFAACNGVSPDSLVGGLTPAHLASSASSAAAHQASDKKDSKSDADKEKGAKDGPHGTLVSFPPTEFPRLGDTQCLLYTNLAAVHVQDGNLTEAEKACKLALQARPQALGPLRTLVYIFLRRGNHDKALERLRKSRMDPASRSGTR